MDTDILSEFKTNHLPLAAYLKVRNVQLKQITKEGNARGTFVFEYVPRTYIIEFNNSQALVEPNDFAEKMSTLIRNVRCAMEI